MPNIDRTGYELAIYRLKEMATGERWKADNGSAECADSFKFRAEVLEQAADELSKQDIDNVPLSFVQGLRDIQEGRIADLDTALSESPQTP
jgi:hypothetical protein